MIRTLSFIALILLSSADALPSGRSGHSELSIQAGACTVSDPTGTPLNVRSKPKNGKVVAKLKNGTAVRVEDIYDEADPLAEDNRFAGWMKVSVVRKGKRQVLGWVAATYLNCD